MTPTILYDGWSLIQTPNSPAALHLLTILALLPDATDAVIALPAAKPAWFNTSLNIEVRPTPNPQQWTQKILPSLQKEHNALLHTTQTRAPLRTKHPVIISPTGYGIQDHQSTRFAARIDHALASGGVAQATTLWPSDHPTNAPHTLLPPIIHPAFIPTTEEDPPDIPGIELSETYILYHGPTGFKTIRKVLDSWTWAGPAIGDFYPLVMAGLDAESQGYAEYVIKEYKIEDIVKILPPLPPGQLATVYQFCSALFHPAGVSAWGGSVRRALACGRPVVALPNPELEAIVGPAALIIDAENARSLSSGLIAITVKDQIIDKLLDSSIKRAAPWHDSDFIDKLLEIYAQY